MELFYYNQNKSLEKTKFYIKMDLRIVQYNKKFKKTWDEFVTSSNNGTLFHSQLFLSYHSPNRFEDHSLLFFNNQKLVAILPAAILINSKERILSSHCGASYGGFVHKDDLNMETALALVQHLIRYAKEKKYSKIQITPTPTIYQSRPNQHIEFALFASHFYFRKRELTSIIDLQQNGRALTDLFSSEARTAYRKAQKNNLIIRDSSDYATFYKILSSNLRERYSVFPTHTLKELLRIKKLFPSRITLTACYYQKKLIAGVVNFVCNKNILLAFYISQDYAFQRYRPLNLTFFEIIRKNSNKNFHYYDLGLFTVNMKPNWGLAKFKESLGGLGVFRDYYEITL